MALIVILGGVRSGKSAVGERLARDSGAPVIYVATARPEADAELAARVAAHRFRRPGEWTTEEARDPDEALAAAPVRATVLVDGLGLWLAQAMHEPTGGARPPSEDEKILGRVRALAETARGRTGLTLVVAEESGLAPVASDPLARRWVDLLGAANQALAAAADRVLLVVAGRPIDLPAERAAGAPPRTPDEPGLRVHGDAFTAPDLEDFAVNVNADGPPSWLRERLAAALERDIGRYPDERPAAAAIAARHRRTPAEVVPTNGAAEAFVLLAAALCPRRAVCVHPAFTEPEAALRAHGHPVERAFRVQATLALDPLAVPEDADLVMLGNPNNPCGTLTPASTLERLCRPGRTVVVDEAFMDFVPGERHSFSHRAELPGVVVVRSLTKLWAIPGVRAGYALAPAPLAAALRRVRPAWSVNALALEALRACAENPAESKTVAALAERREELRAELERLPGVTVHPSAANFLLLRLPDGERALAALRTRGISARPARTFPGLGADHLRVAVRDDAANARLVGALKQAVA